MPPSGKWEVAAHYEGLVASKGLVYFEYFYHRPNFLVNMESLQVSHVKVCLNVIISRHFLFRTLTCYRLFQNKARLGVFK